MRDSAERGDNRTGSMRVPARTQEMVEGTQLFAPSASGDSRAIAEVRVAYAQEGESFGETPPPTTPAGKAKAAVAMAAGGQPTALMDKLGERLVFERAGARLYEALLSKLHAYGAFAGGPSEQDLLHILQEEYEHGDLLERAIKTMGGDPTALTPSANLAANVSAGIPQVLTDPRTNLLQCLEAVLVAELTDNECWKALEELARYASEDELAQRCAEAIRHERDHLRHVRTWVAAGQGRDIARVER